MNDNDPKYYRYLILFNEDVQDADPILHISDMNKLKAMNEGRMHLFDDALNAMDINVKLHLRNAFLMMSRIVEFESVRRGL